MPRKLRLIFPDAVYHVTVRGNNQQKIFKHLSDYLKYLRILKDCKKEIGFKLYAFVLMPNHIHLFIFPGKERLISEIMKKINQTYTQYFNRKHNCSGHLFQGRFFSSIIDSESYFWEVSRYIHLNPVRAGLCQKPEDYRWSSYLAYCSEGKYIDLVDRDDLLEKYFLNNLNFDQKIEEYQKFVHEGIDLEEDCFKELSKKFQILD